MKIKMKKSIVVEKKGRAAGDVIEVSAEEGRLVVALGLATEVDDNATLENKAITKTETRVRRPKK